MAATNSNLAAGMETNGEQGRDGKGDPRRMAGVIATTTLGLSCLIGLAFAQTQTTAQPATSVTPATIYTIPCTDDAARCLAWNVLALTTPEGESAEVHGNGITER